MPPSSMRPLLVLIALLLSLPGVLAAQTVEVGPTNLDPATLAEELELPGTEEAALLVVAGLGIDALEVGFDPIDLDALDLAKNPPLLVRGLSEGLTPIKLRRGPATWDGQLRMFAGRVTKLDVDAVLRAVAAKAKGEAPAAPDFDLFAFYDALDESLDWDRKLGLCDEALHELDAEGPDHRLVSQACDKVAEAQARAAEEERRTLLSADALGGEISAIAEEGPVAVGLVYRKDGRPRLSARGTGARWGIAGAGLLGASIFTYSAVFWETQAQHEYLAFRDAERVGDSLAMSRHLFFTKSFDGRRDASIVGAGLFFTGTLTSLVVQAIEGARFRKARKRLIGGTAQ